MQRLKDKVEGKRVSVFCQGPSLTHLTPEYVDVLRSQGIIIAAVNRYHLVRSLTGNPEILWLASGPRIEQMVQDAQQPLFWHLKHKGLWLTRPSGFRKAVSLDSRIHGYTPQTVLFHCEPETDTPPPETVHLFDPVPWEVISVAAMVLALIKAGALRVAVYGHDGGERYYGCNDRTTRTNGDIATLNLQWPSLCNLAGLPHEFVTGRIINANRESLQACWRKADPEEALRWITS